MVLENERVRIFRLVLAPGQSSEGRTYALRGVRVALTEGEILIKAREQEDRTMKFEPGDSVARGRDEILLDERRFNGVQSRRD